MASTALPSTTRDLIASLGGVSAVAEALSRHPGRIRQAATEPLLPAAWFVTLRDLGTERGVSVPEALFAWSGQSAA